MGVYMKSAVLTGENVAEKKIYVKSILKLTTIADPPLDNHMVYIRVS